MAVTTASFRQQFPEFSDLGNYPDVMLQLWLDQMTKMLDAGRWGDLLDLGLSLATAHQLSIARQRQLSVAFGGAPGAASGPVQSKGVDKVNVSYDTGAVNEEGAGHWNLTSYGQQYIRLARQIGIGPIQVGAPVAGAGVSLYLGGWAGPVF